VRARASLVDGAFRRFDFGSNIELLDELLCIDLVRKSLNQFEYIALFHLSLTRRGVKLQLLKLVTHRMKPDEGSSQWAMTDSSDAPSLLRPSRKLSRRLKITGRRHRIALDEAIEESGERFKDTTVARTFYCSDFVSTSR